VRRPKVSNRLESLITIGPFKYRVVVEFSSYIKGMASFKILRPSGYPSARIKIDRQFETMPEAILGQTLLFLSTVPVKNYEKWSQEYLSDIGKWDEGKKCGVVVESVSSDALPTPVEPEPELTDAEKRKYVSFWWMDKGRFMETATPPKSDLDWYWCTTTKQWLLTHESRLKYIGEGW
jgi:hypothetical protein